MKQSFHEISTLTVAGRGSCRVAWQNTWHGDALARTHIWDILCVLCIGLRNLYDPANCLQLMLCYINISWNQYDLHQFYLCQGGYVCLLVGLLVSRITQKLLYRSTRILEEGCCMGQGRNRFIFVQNLIRGWIQNFLNIVAFIKVFVDSSVLIHGFWWKKSGMFRGLISMCNLLQIQIKI